MALFEAVSDQEARDRLRTELDRGFFVQASAGTGKTRELVSRIVAMAGSGRLEMEGLVAITFTEAAAAELQDRIRRALVEAAQHSVSADSAHRCEVAARNVDLAAIQTIHAFAATLLRTYPLEAGLPPEFAISDDVEQARRFEERFRAWLYEEAVLDDGSGRRDALRRALQLGLTADRLSELAASLSERRDALTPAMSWNRGDPPDLVSAASTLGSSLRELRDLLRLARDGADDPLAREVLNMQFNADALVNAGDEISAIAALQALQARPPRQIGSIANWQLAEGGRNAATVIKEAFKSVKDGVDNALEAHRSAALAQLLPHVVAFVHRFSEERRELAVATFHDLLTWARDLLRDDANVRIAAHNRFQSVFVDEFQDTDPLQAELVVLLCATPAQAHECDWRKLELQPGKLFLVGDPKQSIYRFRRADIGIYDEVYQRGDAGYAQSALIQTFRTVEPIVRWVNHHFETEMQAVPGVQAGYSGLVGRPPLDGAEIDDEQCGVRVVGGRIDGKAAERWQAEATAVAAAARQVVEGKWPISAREGEGWAARPAQYRDICVLLPTRTNLRRLERAFEARNIPYRMESGSLVLNTQEVRDLISCMRAIDDPTDQVALVAALRSPAYGCSDVDLLRWVDGGGPLSYERATQLTDGPVAEALRSLRGFHDQRSAHSPAVLIETFIRDRGLAVQAFGHPRPRDAWRRLRYVVNQARALYGSGYETLRLVLDWLEARQGEVYYDAVAAVPDVDENAVRLMTVHGAKGLEFPIVILTGLGSVENMRGTVHVVAGSQTGHVEVRCGDFQTLDYDRERQKELHAAEQVRLLYVAATRAREHLVLSLFHERVGCAAARIADKLARAAEPLHRLMDVTSASPESEAAPAAPADVPSPEEHAASEAGWVADRAARISALAKEWVITPSGLAGDASELAATRAAESASDLSGQTASVPSRFPRGGTSMGLAVHAVLQWLDMETMSNLDELAAWAAREQGVREIDVARLARRAADSSLVRAVVESGRYWREVPLCVEVGGVLVEGVIDLLYEHTDGSLGVLDYKTDQLRTGSAEGHAEHYRLQGGAYALAVEHATGRKVSSVEFLFPSTEPATTVGYDASQVEKLVAEVREMIAGSYGATGR